MGNNFEYRLQGKTAANNVKRITFFGYLPLLSDQKI